MATSNYRFFTEFLGFKPEAFETKGDSWEKSLGDFIRHDAAFKEFSMPADFLGGKDQQIVLRHLNGAANWIIGLEAEDENAHQLFTLIKDAQSGETRIAIYERDLAFLEQNVKEARYIGTLARQIGRYYDAFYDNDIKTLVKDAFGLPWHKEDWGYQNLMLDSITYHEDDGTETKGQVVYFRRDETACDRFELLGDDLTKTAAAALTFLKDSNFLAPAQKAVFDRITRSPVLQIKTQMGKKITCLPALDMKIARLLQEAGVTIDLSSVVDFHYKRGLGGPIAGWSQQLSEEEHSAERLLTRVFNLSALVDQPSGDIRHVTKNCKETLVSIRGSSHGRYSRSTSRPVNDKGAEMCFDITFDVGMTFKHLSAEQAVSLHEALRGELSTFLQEHGLKDNSAEISLNEEYKSFKIPYSLIEALTRAGLTFDAAPLVERYTADRRARIDQLDAAISLLNDIAGLEWDGITSATLFLIGNDREYSQRIYLHLAQEFETSHADFPEPSSIYEDEAQKLSTLLAAYGLPGDAKVKTHAVRWAGGLTGHTLALELRVSSLEEMEGLAAKLAPLKEQIQPLLQAALMKSYMKNVFSERMFGYPSERNSPAAQEMERFIYVEPILEIERLRQGNPPEDDFNDDTYRATWTNIGESLRYLAQAEYDANNPEIRAIAHEHLDKMALRSPLMARAILQTRKECMPPALPYYPAPSPEA